MKKAKAVRAAGARVRRHRARQERAGKARVEVTVPAADAKLVRTIADRLRSGGGKAAEIRNALASLLIGHPAKTGAEMLAFFRASPLVGVDLLIERDKSPGRESPL